MKKAALTIVMVVFGLSFALATQITGGPLKTQKELKNKISQTVAYPEFAMQDKLNCTVWAIIRADENGGVTVVKCDSRESRMREYVREELAKTKFDVQALEIGKEYTVRFDFVYLD